MSGHSHFKTIMHRKIAEDKKRGKIFSKISRVITLAAREGADPESNNKLKQAIEEAKSQNMPKENIERAIKRGSSNLEGENLETVRYEGFGPEGVAVIIEGITDNKNRTLNEIRKILENNGGKIAESGSVKWLFEQKGVISIDFNEKNHDKEEVEMKVIESGADDFCWDKDKKILYVYTKREDLNRVQEELKKSGLAINSSRLEWVPKEQVMVSEGTRNKLYQLFEELDDRMDVQGVYFNTEL